MIGYKYNTEEEAKAGRKLCADYYGLPKSNNNTTIYWVDYSEASLNVPIFWYIVADSSIVDILGETIEFEIINNEL
tara:strand:- start:3487 stop:3714 length:228 start_codon:yes stop_codon:yes gene_type:complete